MRKTSFFYDIKAMLLVLLAWILLVNEAVKQNGRQENREMAQTGAELQEDSCENHVDEETAQGEIMDQETAHQEITENESVDGETMSDVTETGTEEISKIRVLLMDTGYQSYYHGEVRILYGGEERTYTPDDIKSETSRIVLSEQEDGICVLSIQRQQGNPVYQGNLEIRKTDRGLLLVNELPLETYLEAVVPSEMPSAYEREALKAQAICARTYACSQMQEKSLEEYDADVDDSVGFQVYGNIAPQDSTTAAVRETEGQVLCQDGELIQAYYFSTSAGATSTDEIWGAEQAAPYLKAVDCEFDQEEPWSSWSVTIPWSVLEEKCMTYQMGTLKFMEITGKNQSGAVTGLHVVAESGSFDLSEEYGIREFLSPEGLEITEHDGTVVQGGVLLPSAYFTMEIKNGESVVINGRGFGHGVGMSQTAANEMAAEGYSCSEILDYFFQNVQIQQIADLA